MYEEFKIVYGYICNELFLVVEDGFGTRRMTSLYKLFGGYQDLEEKFQHLRAHSYITDAEFTGEQSSTQCKKATVVCSLYGCGATNLVCRVYMSVYTADKKKIQI